MGFEEDFEDALSDFLESEDEVIDEILDGILEHVRHNGKEKFKIESDMTIHQRELLKKRIDGVAILSDDFTYPSVIFN